MCKIGDIIVIEKYIGEDGKMIYRHLFVVINDKKGYIEGLKYDLVTNVMSSFKNEKHKKKKLKYKQNIEIIDKNILSNRKTKGKTGYIKVDQLIYFNKKKIKYYVLGHISDELLNELLSVIETLSKRKKLKVVANNLNS